MSLKNIWYLGIKELRGLLRDTVMLILIVYAFSLFVLASAKSEPEALANATISIVDEDQSQLSSRIISAFYPLWFVAPEMIAASEMDERMDAGIDTFALNIPPDFTRNVLAGRAPDMQFNVDATRMSEAFTGSSYVQQIVGAEVAEYVAGHRERAVSPAELVMRARYNPSLDPSWFGAISSVMQSITTLSLILTGAALIREKEHGTVEHLLAMPVTAAEIMLSKIWSMGGAVLLASSFALVVIVQGLMAVPVQGSLVLFIAGAALMLFAMTALGVYMATVASTMPQFALLLMLVLLPLRMLSGATTPRESMPEFV